MRGREIERERKSLTKKGMKKKEDKKKARGIVKKSEVNGERMERVGKGEERKVGKKGD